MTTYNKPFVLLWLVLAVLSVIDMNFSAAFAQLIIAGVLAGWLPVELD